MSMEFEQAKSEVLSHIEGLLEEIEHEIALSHQEKYALLEDAFENASDVDELRVAFDQWYAEHGEEIGFEHDADELWDQALGSENSYYEGEDAEGGAFDDDEEDESEEEDEEEEEDVFDDESGEDAY